MCLFKITASVVCAVCLVASRVQLFATPWTSLYRMPPDSEAIPWRRPSGNNKSEFSSGTPSGMLAVRHPMWSNKASWRVSHHWWAQWRPSGEPQFEKQESTFLPTPAPSSLLCYSLVWYSRKEPHLSSKFGGLIWSQCLTFLLRHWRKEHVIPAFPKAEQETSITKLYFTWQSGKAAPPLFFFKYSCFFVLLLRICRRDISRAVGTLLSGISKMAFQTFGQWLGIWELISKMQIMVPAIRNVGQVVSDE